MGELYMDSIDRALAQEYKHFHGGCSIKEDLKVIENPLRSQTVPEQIGQTSVHHDRDAQPDVMLSGIF